MTFDPEQRFITECAKIAGLEKKVGSLKSELKKYSKRLEELEIQGFYDQINALNKKINDMNETLLNFQRYTAQRAIESDLKHMSEALTLYHTSPSNRQQLYENLLVEHTRVLEQIFNSSEPISLAIKFRKHCVEFSEAHSLGVYCK